MITLICILYYSDHLIDDVLEQFKNNKSIEKIIFFDNSKKINRSVDDRTQIIGTGENLGYGGAINEAVKYAKSDWILFANPDIKIHTNNLDSAILSEKTLYTPILIQNKKKIYGFKFPNFFSDAFLLSLFKYLKPLTKICDRKILTSQINMPGKWWQVGALLLIPRDFFKNHNGFDTRFYLNYEDVDFCARAISNGFKVMSASFLSFENRHASSSKDVTSILAYYEMASFKEYYKKEKGLILIVYLMLLINLFHLFIIKVISIFFKNKKIIQRLKFLKYQIKGLNNNNHGTNKK